MNQRRFNIGPGAASLILIIVVLSMSVLGVLTLMNARNDVSLSKRSLAITQETYALNDKAERTLATLDGLVVSAAKDAADQDVFLEKLEQLLPAEMTLEGDQVSWSETSEDGRMLRCAVRISALGETPRLQWAVHALTVDTDDMEFDAGWN